VKIVGLAEFLAKYRVQESSSSQHGWPENNLSLAWLDEEDIIRCFLKKSFVLELSS
jgi:hypothetical protein